MIPKTNKSTSKKVGSRLKPLSADKAKIKRKYRKVCDQIDQEMLDEHGYIFCTSCGERNTGLNGMAHSHNLPVGGYRDFETVKENISPRCHDCHRALDNHNFEDMQYFKDLPEIMTYRLKFAPDLYNRTIAGLRAVGCFSFDYVELDK